MADKDRLGTHTALPGLASLCMARCKVAAGGSAHCTLQGLTAAAAAAALAVFGCVAGAMQKGSSDGWNNNDPGYERNTQASCAVIPAPVSAAVLPQRQ